MKKNKKIEVAVRMRPLIYQYEDYQAWTVNDEAKKVSSLPRNQALRNNSNILNEESIMMRKKSKVQMNNIYEFSLDYVYKDSHSNQQVYSSCCSNVVQQFISGNNATIFMYGQTTSGKTYTMLGNQTTQGMIMHSLRDIFSKKSAHTKIKISYLEIYNEQINDLLQEGAVNLKIADQHVQGLSQFGVQNIQQAMDLLNQGQYQRSYAQKKCHDHSSRSHTIFQIKMMENQNKARAILNLVDLSGNQRLADQENSQQTAYINKSLFVLSNVIYKLAHPKKNSHIPFRDSKLTRLLANSLTTSRKTLIICTISPAQINFSQTLSTLRFATQSRKIQLRGVDESMNESLELNRKKMTELIQENSLLKKNLSFAHDNKECQNKYMISKLKLLEDLIDKKQLKVESNYKKLQWRRKINTLTEEYQKNVQILQKQYLKAMINLTSNQLNADKQNLRSVLGSQQQSFMY